MCVQLIIWKVCLFINWKYKKLKIYMGTNIILPLSMYILDTNHSIFTFFELIAI